MGETMKKLILQLEFAALMIMFWGMIIVWPVYNWIAN